MTPAADQRLPKRALAILAVTLFYRVATSMGPLMILLTLTGKLSLEIATLALTGWTLAGALTQPIWISVAARFGLRRTSLALGGVSFASHVGIGFFEGTFAAVAFSIVAGASLPPITAQARTLLAHLLDGSRLRTAFDAEAALSSSAFVIAPLMIAVSSVAGRCGPAVTCAALLAAVSIGFAHVCRGLALEAGESSELSKHGDGVRMGFPTLTLIFSGAMAYGMLACIEVATVARLDDRTETALVLAAWATSSFFGGLYFSRLKSGYRFRLWLLPFPAVACAVMAVFTDTNLSLFCLALVLGGFAVAPTTALLTSEVARVTPSYQHARAFGWLQASSWLGSAAATSVSGLIATRSLALLLLFAVLLAVLSACAIIFCRWRWTETDTVKGTDRSSKQQESRLR